MQASHIGTTSTVLPIQLTLIMTIGLLPDALKPGVHGARTHWIRGFMAL